MPHVNKAVQVVEPIIVISIIVVVGVLTYTLLHSMCESYTDESTMYSNLGTGP